MKSLIGTVGFGVLTVIMLLWSKRYFDLKMSTMGYATLCGALFSFLLFVGVAIQ